DGVGFAQQLLIDALQDELQLAGTDHRALGLRRDRQRNAERPAAIEALVEQAVAAPVVPEQLRVRAPPVVKHHQQRLLRVPAQLCPHDARQAIEREPQIDRRGGHPDRRWQLERHRLHLRPGPRTRAPKSCSSSAPATGARTRSRWPATVVNSHRPGVSPDPTSPQPTPAPAWAPLPLTAVLPASEVATATSPKSSPPLLARLRTARRSGR